MHDLITAAIVATKALAGIKHDVADLFGHKSRSFFGTSALDEVCAAVVRLAAKELAEVGLPDTRYAPADFHQRLLAVASATSPGHLHRPREYAAIVAGWAVTALGPQWGQIAAALEADTAGLAGKGKAVSQWALLDTLLDTGGIGGAVSAEAGVLAKDA